jgi:hypothetical protein
MMRILVLLLVPAAALTVREQKEASSLRDEWCENGRLLPSVMLLGAQKAGSTSLYRDLIRRFELSPATVINKEADWMAKEVSFFGDDKRFNRGRHFYLKHFPLCKDAAKWSRSMDASIALDHGEFYVNRLADFYGKKAKDLKFIIIVRDPVKRLESEFHHGEEMIGNENTEGGARKIQKESKLEDFVQRQLKEDGEAMKWRAGNQTEEPPKYFKGSSYAYLIKPWLKRFDGSQFIVLTLRQYQARTQESLKFIADRLGMQMTDTKDMMEHVFANENKNKFDRKPMRTDLHLKLQKYFEPLDEEWKKIVETNHMSMEDPTEKSVTLGKPARSMWVKEEISPTKGRKLDQEWSPFGTPAKIYGSWDGRDHAPESSSLVQKTEALAKAHVFVINTEQAIDKCQCLSAQMAESGMPYSASRLAASTPKSMYKECKAVPKLKDLAHRPGTNHYVGAESALFCSNYRAWKEALANHSDKDYIIIMEDDLMLQKKDKFWKKVDWFLSEGKTSCQEWDHINVDPYEGAYKNNGMCPKFKLTNPTQSGGAHMQIIRREKLQELVDHAEKYGAGLVDRFADWQPKDFRRFSWKAGIVQQFNTKGRLFWMRPAKPGYCTEQVFQHQVSGSVLLQDGQAFSPDMNFKQNSGKSLAFGCDRTMV